MYQRKFLTRFELRRLGFRVNGSDFRVSRKIECHSLKAQIREGCRIDDFCVLTGCVELGEFSHISPFVFLSGAGGRISLGQHSGVGSHSSLFTKSEIYEAGRVVLSDNRKTGDVIVGEHAILGRSVTVLPGTNIGNRCVIGAGCVLTSDVPADTYLVSSGARTLRIG